MKLKSIYLEKIVAAMCEHNPAKTPAKKAKYEAIATDWIVKSHNWCLFNSYIRDGVHYLPTKQVRNNFLYRYKVDGKPHYWYDWFISNFPQWHVIKKGFTGFNGYGKSSHSEVILCDMFSHKQTSQKTRIEMIKEIGLGGYHEAHLASLEQQQTTKLGSEIIEQQINIDNLQVYIMDVEYRLESDTLSDKYRQTLLDNLEHAYKIIAILNTDRPYIPVLTAPHGFGRDFHGSVNIQGAHSELRKGALGKCYNIDIQASVFGFYIQELEKLKVNNKELLGKPTGLLKRMLDNRSAFRNALAEDCLDNLDLPEDEKINIVKTALTALGFGAKKDNFFFDKKEQKFRDALPNIIKNKEARDKFLNHEAITLLTVAIEALIDQTRTMYRTDPQFKAEIDSCENFKKKSRMNFKQVLAYRYQQYEKTIRTVMIEHMKTIGGRVLVQTHDGIYVENGVDLYKLEENLDEKLSHVNKYAKVELEQVKSYANRRALSAENHHI